jgi:cytochrome b561
MKSPSRLSDAPRDRYTGIAIVLHWAIAVLIGLNLCTGFFIEGWLHGSPAAGPPPPANWASLVLHASSGLTVLALAVLRVAWRLLERPPPPPPGSRHWERRAARVAHFLLYAAMVLMPLTGWAILSAHPPAGSRGATAVALPPGAPPPSAAPRTVRVWNLMPMPVIAPVEAIGSEPGGVAPQHVLHERFAGWHRTGAWLLLGLLLLHVLGALKHQFVDGQAGLARMGIGRRRPGPQPLPNTGS